MSDIEFQNYSKYLAVAAVLAVVVLGGCATQDYPTNVPSYQAPSYQLPTGTGPAPVTQGTGVAPARYAYNVGTVSSVELVRGGQPSSSINPAGAILGAVVGGLVGNQVGAGTGRAVATGAGILGGAAAGNAIGQRVERTPDSYRIGVQYDNGGSQYIDVPHPGDLRAGDRVRVDGGQISRF